MSDSKDCNGTSKRLLGNVSFGQWCPICKNKTEKKLLEWLQTYFQCLTDIKPQSKYNWCKRTRCLPFDFELAYFNLIMELDGFQHFVNVQHWKNDVQQRRTTDVFKMCKACFKRCERMNAVVERPVKASNFRCSCIRLIPISRQKNSVLKSGFAK